MNMVSPDETITAGRRAFRLPGSLAALLSDPTTKKGRTQRVVLALLQEHLADDALPTSGRFVFYELEQRSLACKPSHDDIRANRRRSEGWPPGAQDITDALTHLRETGVANWEWITDETRHLSIWDHASSVADYLRDQLGRAMINPWGAVPPPLILCESRAMAGVLQQLAGAYCCPIAGTAGHAAGFLRTAVAPLFPDNGRCVLYLGDLDKSGDDIEMNNRRVLERTTDRAIDWRRIGLTERQVVERRITPILKIDGRERPSRVREAWEVEALGQAAVVTLVRETLDALLPEPLANVLERTEAQRAEVGRVLAGLGDQE
jgi:hypothetical protein